LKMFQRYCTGGGGGGEGQAARHICMHRQECAQHWNNICVAHPGMPCTCHTTMPLLAGSLHHLRTLKWPSADQRVLSHWKHAVPSWLGMGEILPYSSTACPGGYTTTAKAHKMRNSKTGPCRWAKKQRQINLHAILPNSWSAGTSRAGLQKSSGEVAVLLSSAFSAPGSSTPARCKS
jgi:hypothetical protein